MVCYRKIVFRFISFILHQNPKDTAKSVFFGFLHSLKGSDPRVIEPLGVTANICSNAGGGVIMAFESGRAAAGAYANTPQGSAECCK